MSGARIEERDCSAGYDLWARSYDRPLRKLLPLQTDLTTSIVTDVNRALRRWIAAKT